MNVIRTVALAISSGFGVGWLPAGGTLITLPFVFLLIKYADFLNPYFSGAKWQIGAAVYAVAAIVIMLLTRNAVMAMGTGLFAAIIIRFVG